MLVLQQLFNLSVEEVEFQVNDRRSFEEFFGLEVMNDIPGAPMLLINLLGFSFFSRSAADG